jgi:hypothetical protein
MRAKIAKYKAIIRDLSVRRRLKVKARRRLLTQHGGWIVPVLAAVLPSLISLFKR